MDVIGSFFVDEKNGFGDFWLFKFISIEEWKQRFFLGIKKMRLLG